MKNSIRNLDLSFLNSLATTPYTTGTKSIDGLNYRTFQSPDGTLLYNLPSRGNIQEFMLDPRNLKDPYNNKVRLYLDGNSKPSLAYFDTYGTPVRESDLPEKSLSNNLLSILANKLSGYNLLK